MFGRAADLASEAASDSGPGPRPIGDSLHRCYRAYPVDAHSGYRCPAFLRRTQSTLREPFRALIHRRSTSRIAFRRERTTGTWRLGAANHSAAVVGRDKSTFLPHGQVVGVNRISMVAIIFSRRLAHPSQSLNINASPGERIERSQRRRPQCDGKPGSRCPLARGAYAQTTLPLSPSCTRGYSRAACGFHDPKIDNRLQYCKR